MSHCESCGKENPNTDDGYTTCCNELVCDGRQDSKFHHEESNEYVFACCWVKADTEWENKYGHFAPNGSCKV